MNDQTSHNRIMRALADYLKVNPLASDTADGIRRWWLGTEWAPSLDEVARALETMKTMGLIKVTYAADGRQRYSRCASDAQLAAFVEGLDRNEGMR
ncbi:MAG TPA: hypothetical protein VNU21_14410 [Usitatibacter sp.]|nr:hypothetical protein [Usitatibacter sp.]